MANFEIKKLKLTMQYVLIITGFMLIDRRGAVPVSHQDHQGAGAVPLARLQPFCRHAAFLALGGACGSSLAQGGGQSLPEFVCNCRLDHACRLMVEQPTMSFVEVGNASGYQRTTTFYHDFKARFGMAPAKYRKLKVKSEELRVLGFAEYDMK